MNSELALQTLDMMAIAMNRVVAMTVMVDLGYGVAEASGNLPPMNLLDDLAEAIAQYNTIANDMETNVLGPVSEIVAKWYAASN